MQYVLLKFGLCHLVVLDDDTPLKGAFIAMYEAFHLNHDVLTKRNYKDLTVEFVYQFLNKTVTIATE